MKRIGTGKARNGNVFYGRKIARISAENESRGGREQMSERVR
jgi:hypothetical protein